MYLEVDHESEGSAPLREWSNTISIYLQDNPLSIEKFLEDAQKYLQSIAPDTRAAAATPPETPPQSTTAPAPAPAPALAPAPSTTTSEQIPNVYPLPPTLLPAHRTSGSEFRPFTNPSSHPDIFAMEEEQEVAPTNEDWQRTIIPNLRMFLVDHQHQLYEIEEYVRVINRHLNQGHPEKAHEYVRNNILSGQPPPPIISRFFPRRRLRGNRGVTPISYPNPSSVQPVDHLSPFRKIVNGYSTVGGSNEATDVLREQLYLLYTSSTKNFGFEVEALHDSLYHWQVKLFQFNPESQLGTDLINHFAIHSNQASFHDYEDVPKKQTPVHIEFKFSHEYPDHPPSLRVIQPQFDQDLDQLLSESLSSLSHRTHTKTAPMAIQSTRTTTQTTQTSEENQTNEEENGEAVEKFGRFSDWYHRTAMAIAILHLREKMIRYANGIEINKQLRVRVEEPGKGLVTVDGFWNKYQPIPPDFGKSDIERGGKIILPSSALAEISTEMETPSFNYYRSTISQRFGVSSRGASEGPLTFELLNPVTHKKTYCGVLEFTAEEGSAIIPRWMMKNLGLGSEEDVEIEIRRVNLPDATFVRLQPHHVDFLYLDNHKAMLEWVLTSYSALSIGDTIPLNFNNKVYYLNVLETKPGRAVSIIDSDVSVDFAPPLVGQFQPFTAEQTESPTSGGSSSLPKGTPPATGSQGNTPKDKAFVPMTGAGNKMTADNFETGVLGVDYEICSNCQQKIAKPQYMLHSISCARLNYYCHGCSRVVQKTQKKEHDEEFHSLVPCSLGCGKKIEVISMDIHKQFECPNRMASCIYCELKLVVSEIDVHQQKCGDITEPCPECKQRVMRRYLFEHPQICGKQPSSSSPTYPQRSTRRKSMILCPECKFPFEDFEELQIHVLTAHDPSLRNSISDSSPATTTTQTQPPQTDDISLDVPPESETDHMDTEQ